MNNIRLVSELYRVRAELTAVINDSFDALIEDLLSGSESSMPKNERTVPLTASPSIFVSKKPIAVLIGNGRIRVKSWKDVLVAVLTHCNQDPAYHEKLMYLRDKAAGKTRMFLSGSAEGMSKPAKIDDGLYVEGHFGAAGMMQVLTKRLLSPIGFDCSSVYIVLKP